MCLQWLNFGPSFYIFSFNIVLTLFVLHENQSNSAFSIKGKVKIIEPIISISIAELELNKIIEYIDKETLSKIY